MKRSILLILFIGFFGCAEQGDFDAQEVVDRCIRAHGSEVLNKKEVIFDFRDFTYTVRRSADGYTYTRQQQTDSSLVLDRITQDGTFERRVNGRLIPVADSMATRYSESINSVAYFFQLPLPLNDPAVIKMPAGIDSVLGKVYYKVAVRFRQDGGGTDYQDEYRYWIGKEDQLIDYLAYNYQTNGGGVRYRVAVNRRRIDGLVVQDYINYRPEDKEVVLDSLPALWEASKLIEVSRIEKENIRFRD